MADIAGATILSLTRESGAWIRVAYSAGASGYDKIYIWVRTLTGSWRQATTDTALVGSYLVTSIAGAPLDANTSYQVKLLAHHTSGDPVSESNTVTVDPWEVATPALLGAERTSPTVVRLSYSGATVPSGAKVYVDVRQTPTGTWAQNTAFSPPSAAGQYLINVPSPDASYEVRIYAGQWGVSSDLSTARSVSAWETPTPTITSVTRTGEFVALVAYEGAVAGSTLYVQRHVPPTGAWTAQAITPTGTSGTMTLSGLGGSTEYDVRAYTMQSGSRSNYSGEKTLEAWWGIPGGVIDLVAVRRTTGAVGTVDLAWSGTPAYRNPWVGLQVYRAEGDLGAFGLLAGGILAGTARTFYDATAKPERKYRYMVVPYNNAGSATSRPVETSNASILIPNAPSSTTAVWVSDTTADVSWPDPAASDRPVTRFIVRRWLLGNWSTVKNDLPGTVLSWRDTGLSKNGIYKYQVQAVNDAGPSESYSPESAEVITTPSGASTVTAVRSGFDITVSWTVPAGTIASSWTVEHTTAANPATALESEWFPISEGTLSGSALQTSHTAAAGGVPHAYRVRPTLTGAPVAPWVRSNQVSQYTTASAPTLIEPTVVDATGAIRLAWIHNSVDGTPQILADLYYRQNGGAWVFPAPPPATPMFYDVPGGTWANDSLIEWRVATEGYGGGAGPESSGSFTTRARPIVSVTTPTPGSAQSSSLLTVDWVTSSQASWTVRLLDANGNVVDLRTGTNASTRTVSFTGLVDRHSYSVQVIVRDAFQESLPATVAFTVELDRPAPPLLVATPNPTDGTVLLKVTAVQGLNLARTAALFAPVSWTGAAGGLVQLVTLVRPDGEVSAVRITGAAATVASTFDGATTVDMRAKVMTSDAYTVTISRYEGATLEETKTYPVVPGNMSEIGGSWSTTGASSSFRVAVASGTVAVWDARAITAPAPLTLTDVTYFDGNTTNTGFVYGWNVDGTAFEATPSIDPADADMPVALTTRVEIIRINSDGSEKSLGDVPEDWRMVDPIPPTCVDFWYVARAWTDAPAYADSERATVRVTSRDVHINYGTGWAGHVVGGSRGFGGAGGGRESVPVVYAGQRFATNHQSETTDPRSGSITVQLLPATGASTLADWMTALSAKGNVTYREPGGLVIEGAANLGPWDPGSMFKQSVQFSITECDPADGNPTSERPLTCATTTTSNAAAATTDYASLFLSLLEGPA